MSYQEGVRAQGYLNALSEAIASETDNGGTAVLGGQLYLGTDYDLIRLYRTRISHVWLENTSDDLSSALSNYPTGGSTPLDNAKGRGIYMKMDDHISDGSTSLTFTAPNGAPANGNG